MESFGVERAFTSWHGAAVMVVLCVLSVYVVALIIMRQSFFLRIRVDSQKLLQETQLALNSNDVRALAVLRGQRVTDPPVRILVSSGLMNADLAPGELSEVLHVTRVRQGQRLTRSLSAFSTLATIAPFLGLLGTVMGIIESFNNLAQSGASGPNVVASGVASALWATAAGLVVAIPSVVAHNIFKGKAKDIMTDMELVSRELMVMVKTTGGARLKAM